MAERAERLIDKLKSMVGIGEYDYPEDDEEMEETEQEQIGLKAVGGSGGQFTQGVTGSDAETMSSGRSSSTQGSGLYSGGYRKSASASSPYTSSYSGYSGGASSGGGIPNNTIPFPKQENNTSTNTSRYSGDTYRRQHAAASAAPATEPKRRYRVLTFSPRSYKDCVPLIDHLKRDMMVIVNFEKLESLEARRIFEFLNGATYALGGKSQKIANKTFMFGSQDVDFITQLDEGKSLSFDTPFRS